MADQHNIANSKRWVIKIGSSLVTNDGKGLNKKGIQIWAEQIAQLREQGKEVLLVSSGAVAEGMARLNLTQRPKALHELQAVAALGQMGLIQHFESCFQKHKIHSAQVLLTHEDLSDRKRYINARSTLKTLLAMGAIPVINENDTVATEEIRLGDNDTLAALVANLVEADVLVLLTDQEGLFTQDPRYHKDAQLINETHASNQDLLAMAGDGGALGQGGMRTKVTAAQRAARSGTCTIIASGTQDNVLMRLASGEKLGTLLTPENESITARKQWLANQLNISGNLHLDAGATKALLNSGVSLLAVGITKVGGQFERGDCVSCYSEAGKEIARGLVNYSSSDAMKIKGLASEKIERTLGFINDDELIHRDNLVLL